MDKFNSYVICLNTNIVYQGVREAERVLNIDHSNISKNCKYKEVMNLILEKGRGDVERQGGIQYIKHINFKYYDPSI